MLLKRRFPRIRLKRGHFPKSKLVNTFIVFYATPRFSTYQLLLSLQFTAVVCMSMMLLRFTTKVDVEIHAGK